MANPGFFDSGLELDMKLNRIEPPRVFAVGPTKIQLKDCAHIELAPDEQVTFVTEKGGEFDVARKSWGFYATPSLNVRLKNFGLRGALVKSQERFFLLLVEAEKEAEFHTYLAAQGMTLLGWLDDDRVLEAVEGTLKEIDHAS
jgi:hypothetical protein